MLNAAGIETRWMAEINIHPASEQRAADSAAFIPQIGVQATIFGFQHNDHRWLEIYDPETGEWLPADATLGVVGYSDWIDVRIGFGDRPEEAAEMIVPFCVVVLDLERVLHENRTRHYLVENFDEHFGGELATLPAWDDWQSQVQDLGDRGAGAFQNRCDLREERHRISSLLETYEKLRNEALSAGLNGA